MNFLRNPISETLYLAQIVVATGIGIAVIALSYRAYRTTKFIGFTLWIASSVISLFGTIGWDIIGHAYAYPRLYPAAVIAYRAVYLINSAVSFLGTVLVIREFVRIAKGRRM